MLRKFYRLFTITALTLCALLYIGCSSQADNTVSSEQQPTRSVQFAAREDMPQPYDFTRLSRISPQPKKPFTIMVYMNGSDLESQYGAGTDDILEMINSRYDESLVNVVLFTGGSEYWWREDIPDGENTIFWLRSGELIKLADAGQGSTGDPRTLAGFVRFARQYFSSERSGLILWNHGGGAVVGYGADERYEAYPDIAMMKIGDIGLALEMGGFGGDKLEFLGFDTCLMATIEMAKIAKDYAKYLIASEEVEPEQGWDYTFLGDIKRNSTGREIGAYVISRYADFYKGSDVAGFITMSLMDLSKMDTLADSFERFATAAGDALEAGDFKRISQARRRTRNFGSGGEDGESDMVDIMEMARKLESTVGQEIVSELYSSLDDVVVIKYESGEYNLGGLSVYYPYFNKESLDENLQTYAATNVLPNYASYIMSFSHELQKPRIWRSRTSNEVREDNEKFRLTPKEAADTAEIKLTTWQQLSSRDGAYIQVGETANVRLNRDYSLSYEEELYSLNGRLACLYCDSAHSVRRTIPVVHNGEDANIIVLRNAPSGCWQIVGAVPTMSGAFNTIDKKLVKIKQGDKLAIRYYVMEFDENGDVTDQRQDEQWHIGEEFTVAGELHLRKASTQGKNLVRKINLIDYHNNNHFINLPM